MTTYGVEHINSSPMYPQSNGSAERMAIARPEPNTSSTDEASPREYHTLPKDVLPDLEEL